MFATKAEDAWLVVGEIALTSNMWDGTTPKFHKVTSYACPLVDRALYPKVEGMIR